MRLEQLSDIRGEFDIRVGGVFEGSWGAFLKYPKQIICDSKTVILLIIVVIIDT